MFFELNAELEELKKINEAPSWMEARGYEILKGNENSNGYLWNGETPRNLYTRLAKRAAEIDGKVGYQEFFNLFWRGWLGGSSPVLANFGLKRGLPIACLTADAVINTPLGGKLVSEIEKGDLVLTHKGRWKAVSEIQTRMSTNDLYELCVFGRTTKTKITGNHPVLTNEGWVPVENLDVNKHLVATNFTAEYPEVEYVIDTAKHCPYEWVEIDGKVCKKLISKNHLQKLASAQEVSIENLGDCAVDYYAKINRHVAVDSELAWCLGLWFADGSRNLGKNKQANGLRITLGKEDEAIAKRWLSCMKAKFNLEGNLSFNSRKADKLGRKGDWITVNLNSVALAHWFDAEFGVGCKVKNLPEFLLNLPKPFCKSFLQGFMLGDGSIKSDGSCQATITNLDLCLGLYNICLKLGLKTTLNLHSKAGALSTVKYVRTLSVLNWVEEEDKQISSRSGILFENLIYRKIKSLTKLNHNEKVWDLTVPEDHSFSVAGVVVHNCFGSFCPDNVEGIGKHVAELMSLTASGGGVSDYLGAIRPSGSSISSGGKADGVFFPLRCTTAVVNSTSQNSLRRGSIASYIPAEHGDLKGFMRMRRVEVDPAFRFVNADHGLIFTKEFVDRMKAGDSEAVDIWADWLHTRMEIGEPYGLFDEAAQRDNPPSYKRLGLRVNNSNLCSEIMLANSELYTFVCCLSSLNIAKYDEWRDTNTIELSIRFLDAVMEEFIQKAEGNEAIIKALNFAKESRALGLGVLGYHSYLQAKSWTFDSKEATKFNKAFFKDLKEKAVASSVKLGAEKGVPDWALELGRRNTHVIALAPTVSNSAICGGFSKSIEPLEINAGFEDGAKGNFPFYNKELRKVLKAHNKDNDAVWASISANKGSVQHLNFLTEHEKEVYRTAYEIDQLSIVNAAIDRGIYVDQGQSLNLFFEPDTDQHTVHKAHWLALTGGLKSVYYCKTRNLARASKVLIDIDSAVEVGDWKGKPEPQAQATTRCIPCEG